MEKYDKEYEEYCKNLPPAERIKEFYDNGGSGLNFNKVS